MLTIDDILNCDSLEGFNELLASYDIQYAWQRHTPGFVYTYSQIQTPFFDEYYSKEIDLICPAAWAFRSRQWPIFTHEQARAEPQFNSIKNAEKAYDIWLKHGFVDAIVCLSGRPDCDSSAFYSASRKIENLDDIEITYFAATRKLDHWLKDREDLYSVPREFELFSPKEVETLKLQMLEPDLSSAELAEKLNISQTTLKNRQKRIAKKFGVKRFSAAVLLLERTGFLD
ncbi:response regulator transcription factor [Curvivirga sp.]|uniref:helix-turn-helix transcriptional regulator n=1 Tax=Curvivirga sp. TaxID=2856848 RepID=UPI003B59F204